MDQRIITLFDEFTHKPLSRSEFMGKLVKITGSLTAAMAVLPFLEVNYANAQTTNGNITEEWVNFLVGDVTVKAFLAKPLGVNKTSGVVVIHENRGLNPHIQDVARRAAVAGHLGLAVDGLSALGGTPADPDQARDLIGKLSPEQALVQYKGAFEYLKQQANCTGNIGCVGFCWGGAMANTMAVNIPELKAAVAFYGRQAAAEDVPKIKAAIQLHYGGLDERINAGIPAYEEALKKEGKIYELYVYENVNHAFHNDTAPTRYNEEAAKLAWERTLAFFKKHLS